MRRVVTYVNDHWVAFNGSPKEQAIGKRLEDIVDPSSRDDVRRALDPLAPAGVRHLQTKVRPRNGGEMHFDVALVSLRSEGRLVGFVGSAVNVTERWVAEHSTACRPRSPSRICCWTPIRCRFPSLTCVGRWFRSIVPGRNTKGLTEARWSGGY